MAEYDFSRQPWASGPAEILEHGLMLLGEKDSDKNRRIAMISVDNAVELMIKTYMSLPRRVTGLKISRKAYDEFSESFPALLSAIEGHAKAKLEGIDLGIIEWYHRIRNDLYHQGNGLTVERRKVEVYAELAKILFKNLFGIELIPNNRHASDPLARFMNLWKELELRLRTLGGAKEETYFHRSFVDGIMQLYKAGKLNSKDVTEFKRLNRIRGELMHGVIDIKTVDPKVMKHLEALIKKLSHGESNT